MPQSSFVSGCQPKPMVLRSPRAKTVRSPPSGRIRSRVACSRFVSSQALHELPTEM
jgi:hypothetical protein